MRVEVDGRTLKLSNLDKVLYPRTGTTKGEVLNYYAQVAPVLLPHLAGPRGDPDPLAARRRDATASSRRTPRPVRRRWVRTADGARRPAPAASSRHGDRLVFPIIDDLATLTWLANLAALELHVHQWTVDASRASRAAPTGWSSTSTRASRPACTSAARSRCWSATSSPSATSTRRPVTSGSKGLHLYAAPAAAAWTPTTSTALAKEIAEELAERAPEAGDRDDDQGQARRARSSSTGRRTPAPRPRSRRTPCAAASARRSPPRVTWDEVEEGAEDPLGARAVPLRRGARAGRGARRPVHRLRASLDLCYHPVSSTVAQSLPCLT